MYNDGFSVCFFKPKVNWVAFKRTDRLTTEKAKIPLLPQLTAWLVSLFQGFEKYLSRAWGEKHKLLKYHLQFPLIPSQRNVKNLKNTVFAFQNVNKFHRTALLLSLGNNHISASGWMDRATLLSGKRAAATAQPDLPYFTSHRTIVLSELEAASQPGPFLTHIHRPTVHRMPSTHHGIHGKVIVLCL